MKRAMPLLLGLMLGASCSAPTSEPLPIAPIDRLTPIGDGTYFDSKQDIYCSFQTVSRDGGKTCERGCAPLEQVDRYCSTATEVYFDGAGGAAVRPPLKYAVAETGEACPRLVKMRDAQVDTAQPAWECSDATQTNIPGFFQQPGRFYLCTTSEDYDLPTN